MTFIGVHPHDGAYLLVEYYDYGKDEFFILGCEASDLETEEISPVFAKINRETDDWCRHPENRELRRLLGSVAAFPHSYTDDGEFQGEKYGIYVDFMRDSVADIRAKVHDIRAKEVLERVEGDLLPGKGQEVLFHLASTNAWVPLTVVGYYVWGKMKGLDGFRVFVVGIDRQGNQNTRGLRDIRALSGEYLVKRD